MELHGEHFRVSTRFQLPFRFWNGMWNKSLFSNDFSHVVAAFVSSSLWCLWSPKWSFWTGGTVVFRWQIGMYAGFKDFTRRRCRVIEWHWHCAAERCNVETEQLL